MPRRPRLTFLGRSESPDPTGDADPITESERETLTTWMRSTVEEIEAEAAKRIEKLRTVGEHPSPLFAGMVREHARLRMPDVHIAALLCVPVQTIRKHYAQEMIVGEAEAMVGVTRNLLRMATSLTDPSAAKVALAWIERAGREPWQPATKRVEVTETKAPPVIDSSLLTDEDRAQLKGILERAMARQPVAGLAAAQMADDANPEDGSVDGSGDESGETVAPEL